MKFHRVFTATFFALAVGNASAASPVSRALEEADSNRISCRVPQQGYRTQGLTHLKSTALKLGGRISVEVGALGIMAVTFPNEVSKKEAMKAAQEMGNGITCEQDQIRTLSDIKTSLRTSRELQLSPEDYEGKEVTPWGITRIFNDTANLGRSVPDTVYYSTLPTITKRVCVIDSGYLIEHEDLPAATGVNGEDFADPGEACNYHGSHVAGTIAAIGNNGKGVVGVFPGGNGIIISKTYTTKNRRCSDTYATDVINAVQACRDSGASITNMSLGGRIDSVNERAAYQELYDGGMLNIAAAGQVRNRGDLQQKDIYPASYTTVMSVAAHFRDNTNLRLGIENESVDISAPGVLIRSTVGPGNIYKKKSGTSMSCPHVAGAALLLWNKFPLCSNQQIRNALQVGAQVIDQDEDRKIFGNGRLNYWASADYLTLPENLCIEPVIPDTPVTLSPTEQIRVECTEGISTRNIQEIVPAPAAQTRESTGTCGAGEVVVSIDVVPDFYKSETSWTFVDICTGEELFSGGAQNNNDEGSNSTDDYDYEFFTDDDYYYGNYGVGYNFDYLYDTIDSVVDTLDSVVDTTDSVVDTNDSDDDTIDSVVDTIDSVVDSIDSDDDTIDSVVDTIDSVVDTSNSVVDTIDSVVDTSNSVVDTSNSVVDTIDSVVDTSNRYDDTVGRFVGPTVRALQEEDSGSAASNSTTASLQLRGCVDEGRSYKFEIRDTFGDGICCDQGNGSYSVSVGNETKTGGEFNSLEIKTFGPLRCEVVPDGSVLCPLQTIDNYCDCESDCTENSEWCLCLEAQACCEVDETSNEPSFLMTAEPTIDLETSICGLNFEVISGGDNCRIINDCVTDGIGNYDNFETCTILVLAKGKLTATEFDTELGSDIVTIGDQIYSGTDGPLNVDVMPYDVFTWASDLTVVKSGWTICLQERETPAPTPASSSTNVPGLQSGDDPTSAPASTSSDSSSTDSDDPSLPTGDVELFCFSSNVFASVKDKGNVMMSKLQVGDQVLTRLGKYEYIYVIDHHHDTKATQFIQIWSHLYENVPSLEVTQNHMIFMKGSPNPVPASSIKIGDQLETIQGPKVVTRINIVIRDGVYSPLTVDGTIVVNGGIIASSYSSLSIDSLIEIANTPLLCYQTFFDIVLKPYRFICTHVSLDLCKTQNERVLYSELGSKVYAHGLQQNPWFRCILLLSIISFYGFISMCLSFYGTTTLILIGYAYGVQNKKKNCGESSK